MDEQVKQNGAIPKLRIQNDPTGRYAVCHSSANCIELQRLLEQNEPPADSLGVEGAKPIRGD